MVNFLHSIANLKKFCIMNEFASCRESTAPKKSSSPVFFTSCDKNTQQPDKAAPLLPVSYEMITLTDQELCNLKLALQMVFGGSQSTNLQNGVVPLNVTPVRPALLPLPVLPVSQQFNAESTVCEDSEAFNNTRAPSINSSCKEHLVMDNPSPKKIPLLQTPVPVMPVNSPAKNQQVNNFQKTEIKNLHPVEQSITPKRRGLNRNNATTPLKVRKRKQYTPSYPDDKKPRFIPKSFIPPRFDKWKKLSDSILQLYLDNRQTDDVYNAKLVLRNQLHNALLREFPRCALYIVGSSMSGLGVNKSDMDVCLMLTQSEIDQEQEAMDILKVVHRTFLQYDYLADMELIYAKVPILRFKDAVSGIEVDLNVNNAVGIRNTQLLNSYSRIDKRVPPLVVLTKLWARYHEINDAKNHTLSSYSLVLMVIHFLQCGCRPPVLPSLQELQSDKFQPYIDVRNLKLPEDLPHFVSQNKQSLGELFLDFLNYFANVFNFSDSVMSVRLGSIIFKEDAMNVSSPKNKKGHWKYICIEEPFDLTNTARSVFNESAFHYLREVFCKSYRLLGNTGNLQSILDLRRLT